MLKILLVDDCFRDGATERYLQDSVEILQEREPGVFEFICLDPEALFDSRADLPEDLDIVVLDYSLSAPKAPGFTLTLGTEAVSRIRTLYGNAPIYLMSWNFKEGVENVRTVHGVDRQITREWFASDTNLRDDAHGHTALRSLFREPSLQSIAELLGIPTSQQEDFERALPEAIRILLQASSAEVGQTSHGRGSSVEFFNWMVDELFRYPGLLCDAAYCAMLLGVTKDYFLNTISPELEVHVYRGPFAGTFPSLWWSSGITEWLAEKDIDGALAGYDDQATIVGLLDVPEAEYSVCVECHEPFPNAMASDRTDPRAEPMPAHIGCTDPPLKTRLGFGFQAHRVLREH